MNELERFESKYIPEPNSGCWFWINNSTLGYGKFRYLGKTIYAHRASYTMFKGEIPVGMFVCHKCDTPPCVNPDHLFLGTHWDNMKDKNKKGRGNIVSGKNHIWYKHPELRLIGEKHWKTKLKEKDVLLFAQLLQKTITKN